MILRVAFAKVGLVGLAVLMLGLAMAAPAGAAYVFKDTIGEGKLSLGEESGVAIHQGPGTEVIYVADTGNNRIAAYGPGGENESNLASVTEPTFLAVDNSPEASNGEIYVVHAANQTITKLSAAGAPIATWGTAGSMSGFGEIAGVSVDSAANLWVLGTDGKLHQLGPTGSSTNECSLPTLPEGRTVAPKGIAVDALGDLYYVWARDAGEGVFERQVAKATTSCVLINEKFGEAFGQRASVGLDEADDSVFLGRNHVSVANTGREVRQFSSGGAEIPPPFGSEEGHLVDVAQLAVRKTNQAVYVSDFTKQYVAIFETEAVEPPEVIFEEPGGVTEVTGTTAHFKAEINPKGSSVTYSFHCSPSCSFGSGLSDSLPPSTAFETVEATAEELQPHTGYQVWITATNAGGPAEAGPLSFTTPAVPPSISDEVATEVSETGATLEAMINPGGAETRYWVEYVTKAQYEVSGFSGAPRTPEETLGAGNESTAVSVSLSGLFPSTPYVFRFVAINAAAPEEGEPIAFTTRGPFSPPLGNCANEIFRTESSAALPDCRAYEQSTPVDKNGGGLGAVPNAVQATEEPDSITSFTQAGIPGGVGGQDYSTYISSRGEGSWSTQGLLPPQSLGFEAAYLGLTPGGRYAVSDAVGVGPGGHVLGAALFRRDLRSGQMTTLVPYDIDCRNVHCFALAGASADGSRIFFESTAPLTGQTPNGQPNVFEWEADSGVRLIDVNEAGGPLPEGGFAGPYDWADEEPLLGGPGRGMYAGAIGAVSTDGSEAFYTEAEEEEGSEAGHGQLYVRKGIGGPAPESVKISAYQEGTSGPEEPAAFLEATPDGRYVFFRSRAALTEDAYAGEAGHESASLYRYDTSNEELIDLTPDLEEEHEDGPGVEGLLGASESGAVAYFVATAALTTEESPTGKTAVVGEPNLYRWKEGTTLAFVATLGGADSRDWSPGTEQVREGGKISGAKTARVDADGGAVVFSSRRALTGAPNRNADTCVVGGEGKCAELFRYGAGMLDCLSCDPAGARPLGAASFGAVTIESLDVPRAFAAPVLPRNLSADGERFFFQTPDPLVAADRNSPGCSFFFQSEEASCMDVYEWEAPGTGSCTQATVNGNDGCVSLISSGASERGSYFADADRGGKNAYFFTTAQLVRADKDQLYDVYDARVEGGFASQNELPTPPCGSRQACQGPQASPGASSTPGTSTFVGPGNSTAKPCKKGFAHRHGRCVKKHKHHKKRHHRRHKKHKQKHVNAKQRAGHGRGGSK